MIARVLQADPLAKVLVYVGFSHLMKDGSGQAVRWMATRLKAKTGIDPLTIDQTKWLEDSTFGGSAGYAMNAGRIAASPTLTRSAVLFADGRPLVLGKYAAAVDLQVAHPRTRLLAGRPDWLARMGLKPFGIPIALLPVTGQRLVKAFAINEADDAVPMDQIVVTADAPAAALMLSPGTPVRLTIQSAGK